jgi:hypothetical protein
MNKFVVFCVLIAAIVSLDGVFGSEEDVVELTDSDFNTRLNEPELATTLVMFCE